MHKAAAIAVKRKSVPERILPQCIINSFAQAISLDYLYDYPYSAGLCHYRFRISVKSGERILCEKSAEYRSPPENTASL